jgi:16S rRNA (cytosine1402-N4)-methyltransferase
MTNKFFHEPVLVKEILGYLEPSKGKRFIDATLGGAGHTKELLTRGAQVLGIDQDPDAIQNVIDQKLGENLTVETGNFEKIGQIAEGKGFDRVDGILFDLGVSSHQFDKTERGFSFLHDAPLDMRMSPEMAVTAQDLVNGLGKGELYELFTKYAQEKLARKIADAIVSARKLRPIETTGRLATIVERVYGRRQGKLHPATKVFQALRMAVNDELNNLRAALPQAVSLLKPGGRLVVISFHQGEDRIVKKAFISFGQEKRGTVLTKKPIGPSFEEVSGNQRSRSAKLRVFEKVKTA